MISLTEQNCIYYLLNKGFITLKKVLDQNIWIEKKESRNNNYAVQLDNYGFFIKQSPKDEEGHIDTLRSESTVYWLARHHDSFEHLAAHLPPIIDYNYAEHIMVTDLMQDYSSLYNYYQVNDFSEALAVKKAILINAYSFDLKSIQVGRKMPAYFKEKLPWSLHLPDKPESWFELRSAAAHQLYAIVQADETFKQHAGELREQYTFNSLVHGDVKWANFLVRKDNDQLDLRLIDWEITSLGESAWDVASVIQSYFYSWTKLFFSKKSHFSPDQVALAMRTFWTTWCFITKIPDPEQLLIRTIKLSAFRMLQVLLEQAHQETMLSASVVRLLQFSQSVLKQPEQIAAQFFNSKL